MAEAPDGEGPTGASEDSTGPADPIRETTGQQARVGHSADRSDEQMLLAAFERLSPQGSLRWSFDDAMRRISNPEIVGSGIEPWPGLPADLWERGRGAKASERVLGDVVRIVAQELTEYTQRTVEGSRRSSVRQDEAVWDALRFLSARVETLERQVDPLRLRPSELDLPVADGSEWASRVAEWLSGSGDLPVVVGELGQTAVFDAVAGAYPAVEGVDPRGAATWAKEVRRGRDGGGSGGPGFVLSDVGEHLRALPDDSRSGAVLSGCIDRLALADDVDLVGEAGRVVVPGGAVVLLVTDQRAWDRSIEPAVRDLLPGRPLHPTTWVTIFAHLGLPDAVWHPAENGDVHAIVARAGR